MYFVLENKFDLIWLQCASSEIPALLWSLFQYQPNFEMSQNGLIIAGFKAFFCICITSDTYSTINITVYVHSINAKKQNFTMHLI